MKRQFGYFKRQEAQISCLEQWLLALWQRKWHQSRLNHRAGNARDLRQSRSQDKSKEACGYCPTNIPFPRFLRRKCYKLSPTEEIPEDIGKDVIDNNKESRHNVEEHALNGGMNKIPALIDSQEHCHNNPSKKSKLILQISLLQAEHKANEHTYGQPTADYLVVSQQKVYRSVPQAQDGEFCQDEHPQCVVINAEIYIPVYILCQGNADLFLLISLQGVNLSENHEAQEQNEKRSVHLSGCQDDHKPEQHEDCCAGAFEEILVQLGCRLSWGGWWGFGFCFLGLGELG